MTDPRAALAEIQQRTDVATEGGWRIWRDLDHQGFFTVGDEAGTIFDEGLTVNECNPVAHVYVETDAKFIAAARTDVPRLAKALADVLDLADSNSGLWTFEIRTVVAAALAGES